MHFALVLCGLFMAGCQNEVPAPLLQPLFPKPLQIQRMEGSHSLNAQTSVFSAPELESATHFLLKHVHKATGWKWEKGSSSKADILFLLNDQLPTEGYRLSVRNKKITIEAADRAGAFYAVQTLRQLMPPETEGANTLRTYAKGEIRIPAVLIEDRPAFAYRGMHLDVGRHFFPKDFIKEYISWLALLKMNRFHWHLTEDQGWRIEIKQYPRLMSHAAWRDSTLVGHYNDRPRRYDKQRYGGYYTQDEVQEIVAFADSLNVTIIPEIEMPGHAQAAISAYPELGCTGAAVPVASEWGIFNEIYCPNSQTFAFLHGVLDEVMALFPGPYIHIGGDEAPKKNWKACNHCQDLIEKYGLQDESGLQSWFIARIEEYVNSKGRRIIGWDEILEGGLAPNATVMSWRGMQGGVEAAKSGHKVIMTPTSHSYFDYYQSEHPDEPLAIGGFLPLRKVYGFNPVPDELDQEEARNVLGGQGNVWSEYMSTPDQVAYMVFPRILAMSEVLWYGPTRAPDSSFNEFARRVAAFGPRLKEMEVHANRTALYDLQGEVVRKGAQSSLRLSCILSDATIQFAVNGGEPEIYQKPILLDSSMIIRSVVVRDGIPVGRIRTDSIVLHQGVKAHLQIDKEPHPSYNNGGQIALHNGRFGSDKRFGDTEWLGFYGEDLNITISLPEPSKLEVVRTRFFHAPGQWIYAPGHATLHCKWQDGTERSFQAKTLKKASGKLRQLVFELDTLSAPKLVSELRLSIPNFGRIPDGFQGAGQYAWTFLDEIVVE